MAVDILGGTVRGSSGRGGVPPVHIEGRGHQGAGIIQEQCEQLRRYMHNWIIDVSLLLIYLLSICLLCVNPFVQL